MRRSSDCSCDGQSNRDFEFEFEFDEMDYEKARPKAPVKPGTRTGGALLPGLSGTTPMVRFACLWNFPFEGTVMPGEHADLITRIAHLILASRNFHNPIRNVRLIGHTDEKGTDAVNKSFGKKRAEDVKKRLVNKLEAIEKGSSRSVAIVAATAGESTPLRPFNSTNATFNRRVEVYLPRNCQTFFAQFDLRSLPATAILGIPSHPNITDKQKRTEQVELVVKALVARRDERAKLAAAGQTMGARPVSDSTEPGLRAAVQALSTMQIELFKEYLPGAAGGINFAGFKTCFERFANGQLRSPHPAFAGAGVGEPEGGFFFLFAEFAMLCYDTRIDWRVWEQALPSLIAPQEIFMHVYHPNPAAPPAIGIKPPPAGPVKTELDKYSFSNFKQLGASVTRGVGQSDAARINDLRKRYRNMTFVELRQAITDNMLRAQNMR